MHFSTKRFIVPASLALLASATLARGARTPIYTSQGFETVGDFSTTGAAVFGDSDPADLYGQGDPYWAPDTLPPSYGGNGVAADVETSNVDTGLQAVSLTRLTSSVDTRWAPSTFTSHPYNPVQAGAPIVYVDWDMNVASGGANDLFGIELNDNASRIAYVAVDPTGKIDDDHAGAFNYTGTSVSTSTWEHYELVANFATQTYQVFLNGSLTPLEPAVAFEDPANAFTDASLVSYSANGGAGSGVAYYDNYVISVPEPAACGSVLAGSGLLLLRRRRDNSTV